MATMNVSVSSHTFVSNRDQSADYSSLPHPRTALNFYTAAKNNFEKWANASSSTYFYVEAALLRFQRPNALKYSRITKAVLHLTLSGILDYEGSLSSKIYENGCMATYTTDKALSAVAWRNYREGVTGDWSQIPGMYSQNVVNAPKSYDADITSFYNGDLSGTEFTLVIAAGIPTSDLSTGSTWVEPSSTYLTLTYEPGTQPAPTPLYPKDQTIIESSSTLFSWQFNSETEAVQTAAELQYKNVEDENYTTVSLTQATPSYMLQQALPVGSYQWRVKVTNDAGTTSSYSEVAYFNIIGRPASPIINEPANKTLTEITWNTVDQQSCEIILADVNGVELYHETLAKSEAVYRPNFFLNGSYMFSVRVMNASALWSDWAQRAFTISAAGPSAATLTLVTVAGDPAVNLSYTLPQNVSAVLMRSLNDVEKVLAHLDPLETTYRDDTVAGNQNYKYWIRTYEDGYTDTAKITTSVSFEGSILNGSKGSLNLKVSEEKFLPHAETVSRAFEVMNFSGREYPMIERGEFTTVEISKRFFVTPSEKITLDSLCKEEHVLYRDTKGNAFPAAVKSAEYNAYMNEGYLTTISLIRLYEEEVLINV